MTEPPIVLVTGGSGVVGGRVAGLLAERDWRVRALVHSRLVPGADELVEGELGNEASLHRAVDGVRAIVHAAAVTHSRRARTYETINVAGTANLLRAAQQAGVGRFLHLSSRAISAEGGAYSRSKLRAEELVRERAPDHVIVRLPELYGGGGIEGIDGIITKARRGSPIPIVGRSSDLLCPVHVDDAVAALAAALESAAAAGATYTLAGDCMSNRELAQRCLRAFGSRSRLVTVPQPVAAAASLLARVAPLPLYPDQLARLRAPKPRASENAARDLAFRPRRLEEGLAQLGASTPESPKPNHERA